LAIIEKSVVVLSAKRKMALVIEDTGSFIGNFICVALKYFLKLFLNVSSLGGKANNKSHRMKNCFFGFMY